MPVRLFMGCSVGLKYAKNALAAGVPPRTLLGELTTLPQTPSRLGPGAPCCFRAGYGPGRSASGRNLNTVHVDVTIEICCNF